MLQNSSQPRPSSSVWTFSAQNLPPSPAVIARAQPEAISSRDACFVTSLLAMTFRMPQYATKTRMYEQLGQTDFFHPGVAYEDSDDSRRRKYHSRRREDYGISKHLARRLDHE